MALPRLSSNGPGSKRGSPLNSNLEATIGLAVMMSELGISPISSPADTRWRPGACTNWWLLPLKLLLDDGASSSSQSEALCSNWESFQITSSMFSTFEALRPMLFASMTSVEFHASTSLSRFRTTRHCTRFSFAPRQTSAGQVLGRRRYNQSSTRTIMLTPRLRATLSEESVGSCFPISFKNGRGIGQR